ncbi:MAG: hypothetical protein ACT4QE_20425 [Anaerolineales bacterium]
MEITPSLVVKELLDPDEILQQEFEYARETALQANGDRTQIVNLYLILVGGLGSLVWGLPAITDGNIMPPAALAVASFVLGILGLFTILKLVWLRRAWHDSVLTMNRIKDFYLAHYPEMGPAFRWRTTTIPHPGRVSTITFDLAVLVALIDSLAVVGALFFLGVVPVGAVLGGAAYFAAQLALYFRLLAQKPAW